MVSWFTETPGQKCWPIAQDDKNETDLQCEGLLNSGVIEQLTVGEMSHVCIPTFLVDKRGSPTRRLVIVMESLIPEAKHTHELCSKWRLFFKVWSSVGTQTSLTWRVATGKHPSQERRPICLHFAFPQGGVFDLKGWCSGWLMLQLFLRNWWKILTCQCKSDLRVRDILNNGHLASFFEDTVVGAIFEDVHLYLLEKWFWNSHKHPSER